MPICLADVMMPVDERLATNQMTTSPVTVTTETPVREAAWLMYKHGVTQLPILEKGGSRLVGIVRQSDLLAAISRPAGEISQEISEQIIHYVLGWDPASITVETDQGVVKLGGHVERSSMIGRLIDEVRSVDGVVEVEHCLTYGANDSDNVPVG